MENTTSKKEMERKHRLTCAVLTDIAAIAPRVEGASAITLNTFTVGKTPLISHFTIPSFIDVLTASCLAVCYQHF